MTFWPGVNPSRNVSKRTNTPASSTRDTSPLPLAIYAFSYARETKLETLIQTKLERKEEEKWIPDIERHKTSLAT
jgi:hypothetical protein